MFTRFIAVIALAIGLPMVALAQPFPRSDLEYCHQLSDTYVRYVGHDEQYGRHALTRGPLEGQVAVAQCGQGNAAAAIPVLERELLAQKITLPPRG